MKAKRLGVYVAGATIGVGLAYVLAILPNTSSVPASPETSKAVAKKGDGKGVLRRLPSPPRP